MNDLAGWQIPFRQSLNPGAAHVVADSKCCSHKALGTGEKMDSALIPAAFVAALVLSTAPQGYHTIYSLSRMGFESYGGLSFEAARNPIGCV